jgi:hypothetical protein
MLARSSSALHAPCGGSIIKVVDSQVMLWLLHGKGPGRHDSAAKATDGLTMMMTTVKTFLSAVCLREGKARLLKRLN